jgi:hypothetical protein
MVYNEQSYTSDCFSKKMKTFQTYFAISRNLPVSKLFMLLKKTNMKAAEMDTENFSWNKALKTAGIRHINSGGKTISRRNYIAQNSFSKA